jgi:hypothetical protein
MRIVIKSIVEHITSARSACEEYQAKGFFGECFLANLVRNYISPQRR